MDMRVTSHLWNAHSKVYKYPMYNKIYTALIKILPILDEEEGDVNPRIGIINNRGSEFHCQGALSLVHWDPAFGMNSLKTSRLKGTHFYNVGQRVLRNRHILHATVDGNCCWKLHSRRNFRGRFEVLRLGHDGPLEAFFPKSIKKVSCSTI